MGFAKRVAMEMARKVNELGTLHIMDKLGPSTSRKGLLETLSDVKEEKKVIDDVNLSFSSDCTNQLC